MTARERSARRDVRDEVIDKDGDGPHRISVAIGHDVERKVEVLPRAAPPGSICFRRSG